MGKTETNKQWTTYRILDATIDNPDFADPLTIGSTGAGKGLTFWADTSGYRVDWDEAGDGGKGSFEIGADQYGVDAKFFGNSASHYLHWDQSVDDLILYGADARIISESTVDATNTTSGSIQTDGGVGIAMKLFVGTNLDVAGTSALDGNVTLEANLYMPSAGVIDFNSGNFTITHSAGKLTFSGAVWVTGSSAFAGAMTFSSDDDNKMYFRDTGIYIYSPGDGKLGIYADGTGADAIYLHAGAGGSVAIYQYLRLIPHDSDGDTAGQFWYDNSENKLKYYNGTSARTVVETDISGKLVIGSAGFSLGAGVANTNLWFYDEGVKIFSPADAKLTIDSDGTTADAIYLHAGAGGSVAIYQYLRLIPHDSDGDTAGQFWYDNSENKLKYYNGTSARTVVETDISGKLIIGTAGATIGEGSANRKLSFYDSDCYISSPANGQMKIGADGATSNDIVLQAGATTGGVRIIGFLCLHPTGLVGAVEGQLWYDSGTNKLHFWDGTGEREVQSA